MFALRRLGHAFGTLTTKMLSRYFPLHGKMSLINLLPLCLCIEKQNIKTIEFQGQQTLTHEYLIKQASSVAANAATQLLTQTVVAIIDTAEEYKKALLILMSLLEETKNFLGNSNIEQELSDIIISSRAKVNEYKGLLLELDTLLNYVEKVAVSTAETSFLAGAEFISTSLSERLESAKIQVEKVRKDIQILEQDLLRLQKDVIIETAEYKKSN